MVKVIDVFVFRFEIFRIVSWFLFEIVGSVFKNFVLDVSLKGWKILMFVFDFEILKINFVFEFVKLILKMLVLIL